MFVFLSVTFALERYCTCESLCADVSFRHIFLVQKMNRVRLLKEENDTTVVLMPRRHERPPAYGVSINASQDENEYDIGQTSRPPIEDLSDSDSIMSASGVTPIMDGKRQKHNGDSDTSVVN